jgi:hypothetical protein
MMLSRLKDQRCAFNGRPGPAYAADCYSELLLLLRLLRSPRRPKTAKPIGSLLKRKEIRRSVMSYFTFVLTFLQKNWSFLSLLFASFSPSSGLFIPHRHRRRQSETKRRQSRKREKQNDAVTLLLLLLLLLLPVTVNLDLIRSLGSWCLDLVVIESWHQLAPFASFGPQKQETDHHHHHPSTRNMRSTSHRIMPSFTVRLLAIKYID